MKNPGYLQGLMKKLGYLQSFMQKLGYLQRCLKFVSLQRFMESL